MFCCEPNSCRPTFIVIAFFPPWLNKTQPQAHWMTANTRGARNLVWKRLSGKVEHFPGRIWFWKDFNIIEIERDASGKITAQIEPYVLLYVRILVVATSGDNQKFMHLGRFGCFRLCLGCFWESDLITLRLSLKPICGIQWHLLSPM